MSVRFRILISAVLTPPEDTYMLSPTTNQLCEYGDCHFIELKPHKFKAVYHQHFKLISI